MKREAILTVSKLIRRLADNPQQKVRMLELGCGEAQIIGALVEAHAHAPSINASHGIDYSSKSIEICRRLHPGITFTEGDFTHRDLMSGIGQFEVVLLVNALHEVFSADYSLKPGDKEIHLFHFSVNSIRRLLDAAGFECRQIGPDFGILELSHRLVNGTAAAFFYLLGVHWYNSIQAVAGPK